MHSSLHAFQSFGPAFAKADAKAIVLVARKASELETAASELRKINPNLIVLTQGLDIRDEDGVRALFAEIKSELGTVDVLINNAGAGADPLPIRDIDAKDFWNDFVSIITFLQILSLTTP